MIQLNYFLYLSGEKLNEFLFAVCDSTRHLFLLTDEARMTEAPTERELFIAKTVGF
jgi:hypothetical protein